MNGNFSAIIGWIVSGLLSAVTTLLGMLLAAHKTVDDERHKLAMDEIKSLRESVHKLQGEMASATTLLTMRATK